MVDSIITVVRLQLADRPRVLARLHGQGNRALAVRQRSALDDVVLHLLEQPYERDALLHGKVAFENRHQHVDSLLGEHVGQDAAHRADVCGVKIAPQILDFFLGELEPEIVSEPFDVVSNLSVERLVLVSVDVSKIGSEHHLLPAYDVDLILDVLGGDDRYFALSVRHGHLARYWRVSRLRAIISALLPHGPLIKTFGKQTSTWCSPCHASTVRSCQ
jgi:hypothetical protein